MLNVKEIVITKKRNFIINIWLTQSTVHSSIFVVGVDLGFWAAKIDDTLCVYKKGALQGKFYYKWFMGLLGSS